MVHLQIESLQEQDLPEVARYVEQALRVHPQATEVTLVNNTQEKIERRLNWRLFENPARRIGVELGQCLRSNDGTLVGVMVHIPTYFRLGDQRVLGLCSSTFFVDDGASFQSFLMFRRLIRADGADFAFATTCNQTSAALWEKVGGMAVPGSQLEFLLPLRYGPLAEELAFRRIPNAAVSRLAGAVGACSTLWLGPRRRSALRKLEPCYDWELLASIAEQSRHPAVLTSDRSADYLRWRFHQGPSPEQTQIFRYENETGDAGWFALKSSKRGRHEQIRTQTVIDLVRPRTGFSVPDFLVTLADLCWPQADLVTLQGRPKTWQIPNGPKLITRPFEVSKAYVVSSRQADPPLAECMELVPAIGDALE